MDISKLHECIEWSKLKLETPCENRVNAVKQFVGIHYSDNGSEKRVPVNFLELAIAIYVRLLATRAPRCQIKPKVLSMTPFAASLEEVVNQIPGEIGLDKTMRRAVLEAMFSIGIVKVGIGATNENAKIGDEPFVTLVQLDDYFVDMSARSWEEVQYEGNEYWMDRRQIHDFYGVDLDADEDAAVSTTGVSQAKSVSVDETPKTWSDRVQLRDVYLVREGRMVTYAVSSQRLLRDVPWDGPEGTPYIKLWFSEVPGNLMPLAPIAVWTALHELGNALFRKLAKQADAKKTVMAFQGGSDEQIQRLRDAVDGEGIRYDAGKPEEITVGGIDNATLAFVIQLKDLYSMFAGNLDALGGLSPQAETATQEKLISEASSSRVQEMIDRTVDFAKAIFRRLAWYAWTDPVRQRHISLTVDEKTRLTVEREWTPETRDGDFLDYNIDIDVFSMQDDTPQAKVQKLLTVLERVVFPMLQNLQEQGGYIDTKAVLEYVGKHTNMPELAAFVKFMDGAVNPGMPAAAGESTPEYVSTKSPFSRRVYERVNRPGATRQGRDAALMQTLLGGKPQQAEMAALSTGRSMT
ncbi:MAG: hypothetical protein IJI35_02280 [Kiritimatiellae bacterium]|nr:hypothetical protein [Kiritimatiellia bacterium]